MRKPRTYGHCVKAQLDAGHPVFLKSGTGAAVKKTKVNCGTATMFNYACRGEACCVAKLASDRAYKAQTKIKTEDRSYLQPRGRRSFCME